MTMPMESPEVDKLVEELAEGQLQPDDFVKRLDAAIALSASEEAEQEVEPASSERVKRAVQRLRSL